MRILITSGGTKVAIDPVRNIKNISSGRFGSELALSALTNGAEVTFLTSTDALTPFTAHINFDNEDTLDSITNHLIKLHELYLASRQQYQEIKYNDFYEYAEELEFITKTQKPDIIILAAAVSDYLVVNYSDQKVRSQEALTIQLKPAPKLINSIKKWSPESFVVGFKLLVDVSEEDLLKAAKNSIEVNNLDLLVANDLASIRRGAHEILVVEPDGRFNKYTNDLANHVIKKVLEHYKK